MNTPAPPAPPECTCGGRATIQHLVGCPMGEAAELWFRVHRHGDDLAVSPGFPTREKAEEGRSPTTLGLICSTWLIPSVKFPALAEARAEIERLRAELVAARNGARHLFEFTRDVEARAEAAESALAKQRAALERIVEEGTTEHTERIGDPYSDYGWQTWTEVHPLAEIARTALASLSEASPSEGEGKP